MQALGVEISHHVPSRAIFDAYLAIGYSISNEVVSNVDMPGSLAAGSPAVVFEFDEKAAPWPMVMVAPV